MSQLSEFEKQNTNKQKLGGSGDMAAYLPVTS
jgi:hypothetical protein